MTKRLGSEPKVTPKQVVNDSVAAVALAVGAFGLPVSLAALIFAGPLDSGLARATSSFIIGSAIIAGWVAWRSEVVPSFGSVQDAPAVLMVPVAVSVAASSGDSTDVLVLLGAVGLTTGLAMLLAGRFRLGAAIRYLPTTVVGAFMAGTGWFLAKGGIAVMIGRDPGLGDVRDLFGGLFKFWLPGLLLAIVIILIGRLDRLPPEAASVVIISAAAAFYALTFATSSVSARESSGWLIGPFPDETRIELLQPSEIAALGWGAIGSNLPALGTVVAVSLLAVLLNLSGLEFVDRKPLDQDRELRLTGVANLLVVPFGSLVGYVALGNSLLARRLGSRTRTVPLIAAALTAAVGLVGPQYVGFVPKFIAGGLLIAVGLDLLLERIESLVAAQWSDRILTAVIVVSMATIGIIEGLVVGVVIACAMFVVRYSHIDPVLRQSSGFHTSQVERNDSENDVLVHHAGEIVVYELQGYLFFGSAVGLAGNVRTRCGQEDPLTCVVLDFRRVTGLDSSGFAVLGQIHSEVQSASAQLVLAGLSPGLTEILRRSDPEMMAAIVARPDLDLALEWCEDAVLDRYENEQAISVRSGGGELSTSLASRFSSLTVASDAVLVQQGAAGDTLLFVVSGELMAVRVGDDGSRYRLRRFGSGTWIGEVSFFTRATRSAEVVAVTDVEVLQLTRPEYERLRATEPSLVLELHDQVMAAQAARNASLSVDLSKSLSQ